MTGGCAVPCRGGDSRARRCTGGTNGPPLKWRRPKACHCEAPKGPWRPERAARGSALGVQSRSTRLDYGKAIGETATACTRLPRRFAPRNDKFESLMPPNYRPNTCSCQWRSGNALQTQSACAFLSLPCTSCKCLTPHFTRILRPGGGENTALYGKTHIFPHVLRPKRRTMGGKPAKE